jgi:hypothetical protein
MDAQRIYHDLPIEKINKWSCRLSILSLLLFVCCRQEEEKQLVGQLIIAEDTFPLSKAFVSNIDGFGAQIYLMSDNISSNQNEHTFLGNGTFIVLNVKDKQVPIESGIYDVIDCSHSNLTCDRGVTVVRITTDASLKTAGKNSYSVVGKILNCAPSGNLEITLNEGNVELLLTGIAYSGTNQLPYRIVYKGSMINWIR